MISFSNFVATADNDVEPQRWQSCIDIEKLEHKSVLTLAEYMLSLVSVKWTFSSKYIFSFFLVFYGAYDHFEGN